MAIIIICSKKGFFVAIIYLMSAVKAFEYFCVICFSCEMFLLMDNFHLLFYMSYMEQNNCEYKSYHRNYYITILSLYKWSIAQSSKFYNEYCQI